LSSFFRIFYLLKTTTMHKHPTCPICKDKLFGRSDKRFCSVKCKNQHHQIARRYLRNMVEMENQRRERNLTLLEGLMDARNDQFETHLNFLSKQGFHLEYCHLRKKEKSYQIYSCYHFVIELRTTGFMKIRRQMSPLFLKDEFYQRYIQDRIRWNYNVTLNTT
jgi:hypothetical protein